MRFLVIGAGKQGSACALDLLQQPQVTKVILADKAVDSLPDSLTPFKADPRLELRRLDLNDETTVRAAMAGVQSVLSAAPYYFNEPLAKLAIETGAHFADLGGNTEIVFQQKKLDGAAKAKGVSVIPDCGLAPGMVNILAGEGIRRLDTVERCRSRRPAGARRGSPTHASVVPCAPFFGVPRRGARSRTHRHTTPE